MVYSAVRSYWSINYPIERIKNKVKYFKVASGEERGKSYPTPPL